MSEPIELVVEVVSTNWEDNYIDKIDEYQRLEIKEYWIVDYLAIASRSYLGNPKQGAIFVYNLVDGEYQQTRFSATDKITSLTFSELNINVKQIIAASGLAK